MRLIKSLFTKLKWFFSLEKHYWVLGIKKINDKNFKILKPPKSQFWADPFILEYDSKIWVFFEALEYKNHKGFIAVGEYRENLNKIVEVRPVLIDDFHFSYPMIFQEDNDYFMIPETHQKKKVMLYKFREIPYKVDFVRVLLDDIDAADSTLVKHKDNYYLFCNIWNNLDQSHNKNLEIYFSDDLINGQFNKIESVAIDLESSSNTRMAGNFILSNGEIYRFSQNCSKVYGENINVNQVLSIDGDQYLEKYLFTIQKPSNTIGMHTYNVSEKYVVTDFFIEIDNVFEKIIKTFLSRKTALINKLKVLFKFQL